MFRVGVTGGRGRKSGGNMLPLESNPYVRDEREDAGMIELTDSGVFLAGGTDVIAESDTERLRALAGERSDELPTREEAARGTIAWRILQDHNTSGDAGALKIRFDAMASHDITFVSIIQTARASGMDHFPLPYVLTCCHNSLCAVGGTINDDDHLFGLSAARKYGGIFVPPHIAVIHQFMRENFAGGAKMILGSDSHTRYGALGCMAVGEGGGELVKQLTGDTWDLARPEVVCIYLEGAPKPYVGPQDVALAIIGAVFESGYVKNKVMEFVGPGVSSMTTDYRNGVDVMTTETTCLSSVWRTDGDTRAWLALHHREDDFEELEPADIAYYDGCVRVDLSEIEPMIALPFHPSNVHRICDLVGDTLTDVLRDTEKRASEVTGGRAAYTLLDKVGADGRLMTQQGVIAGCAGGTYTNIVEAAHALRGADIGSGEFYLSVYPSSQPVFVDLDRKGLLADLMDAGAIVRTAFCGPCFGAGDTPANNALSIRHATRNFPNREGSKPSEGQMSAVALMDARSIAATAANGGVLTSAAELDCWGDVPEYRYDDRSYQRRVFRGYGEGDGDAELRYGPNIKDWPEQEPLAENVLLKIASKITDEVTTTDELIPSGETSSYRSNPLGLAEFTLSRRDPDYVGRAKAVRSIEEQRLAGETVPELEEVLETIRTVTGYESLAAEDVEVGSTIYARKPGDGSAREQAASSQRVLGALANITAEYATKRYRSNCMNWGMLPFQYAGDISVLEVGSWVFVPGVRTALNANVLAHIPAWVVGTDGTATEIELSIAEMTGEEREIVKAGCLINYNRNRRG